MEALFTLTCQHKNFSVIYTTQNCFYGSSSVTYLEYGSREKYEKFPSSNLSAFVG